MWLSILLFNFHCCFSINSVSTFTCYIFIFSISALLLIDDLVLGDLELENFDEDWMDHFDFTLVFCFNSASLSCSAFLIQLWIFCLNTNISASISSNYFSSSSWASNGNRELYSLCTSISCLNISSICNICSLAVSTFLDEHSKLSTALDFFITLLFTIFFSLVTALVDTATSVKLFRVFFFLIQLYDTSGWQRLQFLIYW